MTAAAGRGGLSDILYTHTFGYVDLLFLHKDVSNASAALKYVLKSV